MERRNRLDAPCLAFGAFLLGPDFTEYSWDHDNVAGDGSGLDDTGLTWAQYIRRPGTIVDDQVRLIDPARAPTPRRTGTCASAGETATPRSSSPSTSTGPSPPTARSRISTTG